MVTAREELDKMTVEQLSALKALVSDVIKAKGGIEKEEKKAAAENAKAEIERKVRAAIASKLIRVGTNIVVMFKGKEQVFDVRAISEKTFTVSTEDGLRYIKFAAFVRFAQ